MDEENQIVLTEETQKTLLETAKWVKYFIILIVANVVIWFVINLIPSGNNHSGFSKDLADMDILPAETYTTAIVEFIIQLAVCIFPIFVLNKFMQFIKAGYQSKKSNDFEKAFSYHRQMFIYLGIATSVILLFFILYFINTIYVMAYLYIHLS